ncbi:hypothetical protein ANN_08956 [Periplaneta americana]|uniref:Reverse transcriptase domain-containing protein n=1 Tax=Periplaneta americana TaxID=6978 RepID=A0ABQ8T4A6_PERAM|nr:hypothetical protein ANN_08956 [Periplaneta americana]
MPSYSIQRREGTHPRFLQHKSGHSAKVDCKKQSVCRRHERFFDGRSSRHERLCSPYGRCVSSVPAAVELQKMEEQLGEEQFDLKKGKDTRDAIGLLRTIHRRYLEKNKDVYVAFVDLEKAFDRVD